VFALKTKGTSICMIMWTDFLGQRPGKSGIRS